MFTSAHKKSVGSSGHRAQHVKPSLFVRKGAPFVVGTALGAGVLLMGTGTASAASADDFAKLRQCESGDDYSINTGNGYYGAYQFSAGTWRSIGFSGLPHQASPATQDAAARALQARSGWGQWPACSRKLGLRNGAPAAAPAVAPAPPKPVAAPHVPRANRGAHVAVEQPDVAPKESPAPEAVVAAGESAPAALAVASQKSITRKSAVQSSVARATSSKATSLQARATSRTYQAPTAAPAFAPRLTVTVQPNRAFTPAVKAWQARMAERGWTIAVDGFFGPESESVVRRFAAEKGMLQGPVVTLDKTVFDGAWTAPVTA